MFTGIVQKKAHIDSVNPIGEDVELIIACGEDFLAGVVIGDSICVSGACLTVTRLLTDRFSVDVSNETLRCTTLGSWQPNTSVNLERSVTPTTVLGGHLVSGHVDGTAQVTERAVDARSIRYTFRAPESLSHYIASKGSVCLDGISLTVNSVEQADFSINIIPHTSEVTTIGVLGVGDHVNLEVDQIARYCERLLGRDK